MDNNELKTLKRALGVQIEQKIREFEQTTGLEVTAIKINRDGQGIESVDVNEKGKPFKEIRKRVEIIRKAAELPDEFRPLLGKYLKEKELAEITRQSVFTLRQNRLKNVGIPFIKIGRSVVYDEADINLYFEANRVNTR